MSSFSVSLPLSLSLSLSLSLYFSLFLSLSHTHTHTLTHTFSLPLSLSPPLSLSLSHTQVVDSVDRWRLEECRKQLRDILGQEKLAGASLLIFANKQDLGETFFFNVKRI